MNRFSFHRPVLLLILVIISLVSGLGGFYLIYHPPQVAASPSGPQHPQPAPNGSPSVPGPKPKRAVRALPSQSAQTIDHSGDGNTQVIVQPGAKIEQKGGAEGSCTQNNIGGSGNVNNCGPTLPPARHIPDDKKMELYNLLRAAPSKISIGSVTRDEEAFDYAKEWYRLFDLAGWDIEPKRVFGIWSTAENYGVELRFKGPSRELGQNTGVIPLTDFTATSVGQALIMARVKNPTIEPNPDEQIVTLWVQTNPKEEK